MLVAYRLTLASIKMFFRERKNIFWAMFLPLLIMGIFGLLNFGAFDRADVGVVDEAENDVSRSFIESLEETSVLDLSYDSLEVERAALEEGDRALVLVLSPGFGEGPGQVQAFFNQSQPQQAQVAQTVVGQVLDQFSFALADMRPMFELQAQPIQSREMDYFDFLLPGVIAMSVMQIGIFSVTFAFVQLRQRGVLRRLRATPIHPRQFLVAQVITRLIVSVLQTVVLITIGVVVFKAVFVGNVLEFLVLAVLGGFLFITVGLAISGFAKTEEVAAPVANLISLPMMFLSGVFFPRDSLPAVVSTITDFLPLTYLADAMRAISVDGASLTGVWTDLVALMVWTVVAFVVATRAFRWE